MLLHNNAITKLYNSTSLTSPPSPTHLQHEGSRSQTSLYFHSSQYTHVRGVFGIAVTDYCTSGSSLGREHQFCL